MAQRIVVQVGPTMGQEVPIRIVEQNARCGEFGVGGIFSAPNVAIILSSNGMPELSQSARHDGRTILYVRGNDRTKDERIVAIPVNLIGAVKQIVMLFNQTYDSENKDSGIVYWNEIGAKVTPTNPTA